MRRREPRWLAETLCKNRKAVQQFFLCSQKNDENQYLQIDLQLLHHVKRVATQGKYPVPGCIIPDSWVISYIMQFRQDTMDWWNYTEDGKARVSRTAIFVFSTGAYDEMVEKMMSKCSRVLVLRKCISNLLALITQSLHSLLLYQLHHLPWACKSVAGVPKGMSLKPITRHIHTHKSAHSQTKCLLTYPGIVRHYVIMLQ